MLLLYLSFVFFLLIFIYYIFFFCLLYSTYWGRPVHAHPAQPYCWVTFRKVHASNKSPKRNINSKNNQKSKPSKNNVNNNNKNYQKSKQSKNNVNNNNNKNDKKSQAKSNSKRYTPIYNVYKQCFVYHTMLGLYNSKYCNNTNHQCTGQNEYYHRMMKALLKHLCIFGSNFVNYLEVFFVFYINAKNIEFIFKNIFKFYNIDIKALHSIDLFFKGIINLDNFDTAFTHELRAVGNVRIIELPDPVTRQKKLNEYFAKVGAVKFAGWGEKETRLAYKILISDSRMTNIYKQGKIRVLTDEILDIFMETFSSFNRKVVRQQLVNRIFFANEDEIQQYNHIFFFLF